MRQQFEKRLQELKGEFSTGQLPSVKPAFPTLPMPINMPHDEG